MFEVIPNKLMDLQASGNSLGHFHNEPEFATSGWKAYLLRCIVALTALSQRCCRLR